MSILKRPDAKSARTQALQLGHCAESSRPHASAAPDLERRLGGDAPHPGGAFGIAALKANRDLVLPVRRSHHPAKAVSGELCGTLPGTCGAGNAPEAPVRTVAMQPIL